jgi:hypothetical protein
MEISRRVAEQLRQLMRRVAYLESQLHTFTNNTSGGGEHYLVESPVDGIPAFVDPVPGMANCAIVRRFSANTDEDKELTTSTSKQRVYNLGPEVPMGEIVIAHKDAFGDLFIPPGGAGVQECDDPLFSNLAIAELETGDIIPFLRSGCFLAAEIRECDTANAAREAAFNDF